MDEWLWMCSMPGFYRNDFARLLQFFESPEAIRKSEKKQISLLPFLKDRQKKMLEEWRSHSAEEIRHKLYSFFCQFMPDFFCRRNQA